MKQVLVLLVTSLVILLAACSKDKLETKPRIEFKDYNTEVVDQNGQLILRFTFFDKEGDLGKGKLTYIRYRTNLLPFPPGNNQLDTLSANIPEFIDKYTGELSLTIDYGLMNEDPNRNDTMYYKVLVEDREGNRSDTVTTRSFVARQP